MGNYSRCETVTEYVDRGPDAISAKKITVVRASLPLRNMILTTYSSQSTVSSNETSLMGRPTVWRIRSMETKPAGTEPRPMDATVAVTLKQ